MVCLQNKGLNNLTRWHRACVFLLPVVLPVLGLTQTDSGYLKKMKEPFYGLEDSLHLPKVNVKAIELTKLPSAVLERMSFTGIKKDARAKKLFTIPKQVVTGFSGNPIPAADDYLQSKMRGEINALGISTEYFVGRTEILQKRGLNDITFKASPELLYKQLAKDVTSQFSSQLNKVLAKEIEQLKSLKGIIKKSLEQDVDSIVMLSNRIRNSVPGLTTSELNYANLILSGKDNASLLQLQSLIEQQEHNPQYQAEISKLKNIVSGLKEKAAAAGSMKIDSLTAKYEELMHGEKDKVFSSPSKLKKFIKENNINGGKFNILLWAKNIRAGNFFTNPAGAGSLSKLNKFNPASVLSGLGIDLNLKSVVSFELAKNITDRFDGLWHPNGLATYKSMVGQPGLFEHLNGGIGMDNVKALGGVSLQYSQQVVEPNSAVSFFGLARKMNSFTISRSVEYLNQHLSLNISSTQSSYVKTIPSGKQAIIPDVHVNTVDASIGYTAFFPKEDMRINAQLSSSLGPNTITSTQNLQLPQTSAAVDVRKSFLKNKYVVTGRMNLDRYSNGLAAAQISNQSLYIGGRISLNRKNILDISAREHKTSNGFGGSDLYSNSGFDLSISHNTNYKKNGLRYSMFTKLLYGSISMAGNLIGQNGGRLTQLNHHFKVTFPNNMSLESLVEVSNNSFSNQVYLNGDRVTVAPGWSMQRKMMSFGSSVIYESVGGFYQQIGIRNSVRLQDISKLHISVTASLDSRYNIEQYVPVFGKRMVNWGNVGINYSIK